MEPRSHPEQQAQQRRMGRGGHIREGLLTLARVAGQVTSFRPVSRDPGTLLWLPAEALLWVQHSRVLCRWSG